QPFSVVLLDEFEKAHPLFFDLLLQVLGEGRLTDASGRVADFRNCVVIMTSNLGAESFQRSQIGFSKDHSSAAEATRHFVSEVRAFMRPELFNRIDRIVPFVPLDETAILKIAERELDLLKNRDGIRFRGTALNIDEDVLKYLAGKGFDPKYGARPLKRAIERELLVPLAEGLNRYSADLALSIDVKMEDRICVAVQPKTDTSGKRVSSVVSEKGFVEVAEKCSELRRSSQKMGRCP